MCRRRIPSSVASHGFIGPLTPPPRPPAAPRADRARFPESAPDSISICGNSSSLAATSAKQASNSARNFSTSRPYARRPVLRQIAAAAAIHLASAADVAVAEVVQRDGRLNQPLIKQPQLAAVILPQLFPHFVGFEKLARVEIGDALQIQRIVIFRGGSPSTYAPTSRIVIAISTALSRG